MDFFTPNHDLIIYYSVFKQKRLASARGIFGNYNENYINHLTHVT